MYCKCLLLNALSYEQFLQLNLASLF